MDFSVKHINSLFEITTSGDAEPGGFEVLIDALVAHDKWQSGASFILDHTDLNSRPLTAHDMKAIAAICESRASRLGHGKCALVVASNLEFGLARMWDVFVEDKWDVVTKLFRSREEARSWLSD